MGNSKICMGADTDGMRHPFINSIANKILQYKLAIL